MMSGPDFLVDCPACGGRMRASNPIGPDPFPRVVVWSDGYRMDRHQADPPRALACLFCEATFAFDAESAHTRMEADDLPYAMRPKAKDLLRFARESLSREAAFTFARAALWAADDPLRNAWDPLAWRHLVPMPKWPYGKDPAAGVMAEIGTWSGAMADELLAKAESCRRRGDFADALDLLTIAPEDGWTDWTIPLRDLQADLAREENAILGFRVIRLADPSRVPNG